MANLSGPWTQCDLYNPFHSFYCEADALPPAPYPTWMAAMAA
jgi:hypothetical protein